MGAKEWGGGSLPGISFQYFKFPCPKFPCSEFLSPIPLRLQRYGVAVPMA